MFDSALLAAAADLVLPRRCLACGGSGAAWCAACRPCGPHLTSVVAGVPVVAAAAYEGAVRQALLAYKERGRRDLARPLGGLLAESVASAGAGRSVVLVPVPSAAPAARARGGDHVRRLAHVAAPRSGAEVSCALRLVRRVSDSAGLGAAERLINLDGAMAAVPFTHPFPAVVVDDIATSGASIREAVRALRAAGWPVLGAAVIAATLRAEAR